MIRRFLAFGTCFLALLLITSSAGAQDAQRPDPFQLSDETAKPKSYGDVQAGLAAIDDYMGKAQCGGWDVTQSVVTDPSVAGKPDGTVGPGGVTEVFGGQGPALGLQKSKIAKVKGLPGREGDPLGNPLSGMSKRIEKGGQLNDGYQYPESMADGLSTTCPLKANQIVKMTWDYFVPYEKRDQAYIPVYVDAPYFEDPPCIWGPNNQQPPHDREKCQRFCSWLNEFTYPDCFQFGVVGDNKCSGNNGESRGCCRKWCAKFVCTDGWTDICDDSLQKLIDKIDFKIRTDDPNKKIVDLPPECSPDSVGPPNFEVPPTANAFPNCKPCIGGECRCPLPPGAVGYHPTPQNEKLQCPPTMQTPPDPGVGDVSNLPILCQEGSNGKPGYKGNRVIAIQEMKARIPLLDTGNAHRYASFYRRYDTNSDPVQALQELLQAGGGNPGNPFNGSVLSHVLDGIGSFFWRRAGASAPQAVFGHLAQ